MHVVDGAPIEFTSDDVHTVLRTKVSRFGVDPVRSMYAVQLGTFMDLKKFGSVVEYTDALVAAVDNEMEFREALISKHKG